MYEKPLDDIPWEIAEPPKELVRVLDEKIIFPCKALDIGCGTGNYSIFLALRGFEVTGADISERALDLAGIRAKEANVKVQFLRVDMLHEALHEQFDFILDYSLLHHIAPSQIEKYVGNVESVLASEGKLLLVCYSDADERSSSGYYRGDFGNPMYFRSAEDIRRLYNSLQEVFYRETTLGKRGQHPAHCFLFRK